MDLIPPNYQAYVMITTSRLKSIRAVKKPQLHPSPMIKQRWNVKVLDAMLQEVSPRSPQTGKFVLLSRVDSSLRMQMTNRGITH